MPQLNQLEYIKFVPTSVRLVSSLGRKLTLKTIESYGRVCYNSEKKITPESASNFVKSLIKSGHESVIEHISATFLITCSRACSHQIVRHRLCSFSQSSQRYIKYRGKLEFINQKYPDLPPQPVIDSLNTAAKAYHDLLDSGLPAQKARMVLPNAMSTKIVVTTNLRQWRHMIQQRTSPAADEEIRWVFTNIQELLHERLPEMF
jgi:thymidylate synthase (FAD)